MASTHSSPASFSQMATTSNTTIVSAPKIMTAKVSNLGKPTLRDKLAWFSPKTWWGILQLQNASSFCEFQMRHFLHGILGVTLPILVLIMLQIITPALCSGRLIPLTMLSPWTLASFVSIGTEVRAVRKICRGWKSMRKTVDEDALNLLQERIDIGRAHHLPRYDVYLPPEYKGQALLFFPGACVPQACYAQVAAQMSDNGLVVVVVSMEPVTMPSAGLGADAPPMRRIMQQVDKNYLPYPAQWSLGGHSFGAFAAMRLALELDPSCVVLWGSGPFPDATTDVSTLDRPVLVVQGSNDNMAKHTPESWEAFLKQLPPDTTRKVIQGGTHNQFASYANNPAVDGIPGMTKEQQHQEVATATSKFIFKSTTDR